MDFPNTYLPSICTAESCSRFPYKYECFLPCPLSPLPSLITHHSSRYCLNCSVYSTLNHLISIHYDSHCCSQNSTSIVDAFSTCLRLPPWGDDWRPCSAVPSKLSRRRNMGRMRSPPERSIAVLCPPNFPLLRQRSSILCGGGNRSLGLCSNGYGFLDRSYSSSSDQDLE